MKANLVSLGMIFILIAASAAGLRAQTVNNPGVRSVFGKVTAVDKTGKQINIQTASGETASITFDERTIYKRVPPGEKNLEKAFDSSFDEISVGDQAFARGQVINAPASILARQLILMTQREIAQRQESRREEWRQRSVAGIVGAVDLTRKEIKVQMRLPEGGQTELVVSAENAQFRRYEPNSVKFGDATASNLEAIKTGDQIRALGARASDGSRFAAEEIVSGAFRTISGKVAAVNAEKNEFKLVDSQSRQTITVAVSKDSNLRRLPAEKAKELIQKNAADEKNAAAKTSGAANANSTGSVDLMNLLETFPKLTVAELKPGETVVISSVAETGAQQLTAAIVISGIESLFGASTSPSNSNLRKMLNLDVSLL